MNETITRQDLDDLRESLHGDIKAIGVKVDELAAGSQHQDIEAAVAKVKAEAAEKNLEALIAGVNKDRDDLRDWKAREFYPLKTEFTLSKWKMIAIVAGSGTLGGMAGKMMTTLMEFGAK